MVLIRSHLPQKQGLGQVALAHKLLYILNVRDHLPLKQGLSGGYIHRE